MNSDAEYGLEVELAAALLEKILERFAEKIHNHHVVGLVVFGLLITNEMQVGNASCIQFMLYSLSLICALTLSPEFVNELGLPVEHNVFLVLNGFFL